MTIQHPDPTQALVTREMGAPPERVWQAFTDPADGARWMWGRNAPDTTAEMDVRVGGRHRVARHAGSAHEEAFSGIYLVVDPPRRLIFTLHWGAPVGYEPETDEAAIVTFVPTTSGTRVTYHHVGIPDDGISAAEHGKAIAATLEALAALVEG